MQTGKRSAIPYNKKTTAAPNPCREPARRRKGGKTLRASYALTEGFSFRGVATFWGLGTWNSQPWL